ncbi:hypothetical protein [Burkholderia sp. WSM2232]|uniref:hypothetical protein n=1 Tax=Burkholderia sp. WSM2232 TaxID=944436 RepID=UPI00040C7DAB|nr:hypothetical protein [Burkholderia sp. WSM2232]
MSQNRKKRPSGNQARRKPLGKAQLLPHTAAYAHEQALGWHLALAAFKAGKGNGSLLAKLAEVLYLAWYLREADFGTVEREVFVEAERILDAAASGASRDAWIIEADDCFAIITIFDLHERQLLCAPVFAVDEAQLRVARFSQSERRAPW